jgi:hypothetical protein
MGKAYLIMKQASRAWGINYARPHEVHQTRKEANAECKRLNERAQNLTYFVEPVDVAKEQK